MTYLQRSRQPKKKRFIVLVSSVILLVTCLLCLQIFAGSFVGRLAMSVGGPFASMYVGAKNKISHVSQSLQKQATLVNENNQLRTQLGDFQAKMIRFEALNREHEALLSAYGRGSTLEKNVLGNIISRPPQSPYDILIIDAGSDNKIQSANIVYGLGGIAIGRVGDVAGGTSKVILYSNVGEENQLIIDRTGFMISLKGIGGGNMEANVAQEMDIAVGDTIVLPRFGASVVASVVEIESSVTSAFKRVLARAPINVFDLRWVEININQR